MPGAVDEKGLLSDTNRFAAENELFYIILEVIQNRKWNSDKSNGKFVFSTFILDEKRYLVIGYNHFRSDESIKNENTPFNWRKSVSSTSDATIGTRGYGAKLLPFKIGGQYSNYYHLNDSEIFPENLSEWGMKGSIDITELQKCLNSEKEIDSRIHEFRETYINPCNSKDCVFPTLLVNHKFRSSELYNFFKRENFKYFYVFSGYNVDIDTSLDSTLERLAKLYEDNTAEIYQSKNLSEPKLIKTPPENSLGLCEKFWAGEFTLEWMIGEKEDKYWKSICRYYNKHTGEEIFSKLSSNGSKDRKFNIRHHEFKRENLEYEWAPEVSATVAMTSDDYANVTKINGTEAAFHVHMKIQGDIVDDTPGDFDLKNKIRYLPNMSRSRIIVSILKDSVKKNNSFGLHLGHLKKNSDFSRDGAIYEMVSQTIARARDFFKLIMESYTIGSLDAYKDRKITAKFLKYMHVDKVAAERSQKRKKEGIKYENTITNALEGIDSLYFDWDHKDSHISAEYELNGEGIDSLGKGEINGKTVWIALQIKDKETRLDKGDKKKFVSTLAEFKGKKPDDICLSYLILAKHKSFTPSVWLEMKTNDIDTIIDPTGEITVMAIDNDLSNLISISS
jgi:hypothetical protein